MHNSMSTLNPLILTVMFCTLGSMTFGQTDEKMQILRDKTEAKNPSIVSDTSKLNQESAKKGYNLFDIEPSPCSSEATYENLQRISRKTFQDGTLEIEATITANCGASFICEIQVPNDTTLNLLFTEYGDEYFCHCCFQLTYCIEADLNGFTTFLINGKPALETDRVFKKKTEEKELYENGVVKTLTRKLEGEIQEVNYYGTDGKLTRIDTYQNGKLAYSYSLVDGRVVRPDGTVLRERKK